MMLDKLKPYCGLFFNVRYERFAFTPNVTPFSSFHASLLAGYQLRAGVALRLSKGKADE